MMKATTMMILATPFAVAGCGAAEMNSFEGEPLQVENEEQPLWIADPVRKWNLTGEFGYPIAHIKVCFRGFLANAAEAETRRIIQDTLENSWERAAAINFFGFDSCPTIDSRTSDLLVVTIDTSLDGNQAIAQVCSDETIGSCSGTLFGKAPNGDFNRVRFSNRNVARSPIYILHEFGHSLGFMHETEDTVGNPPRLNTGCDAQRSGGGVSLENEGDMTRSVMNKWAPVCITTGTLSSWDIMGARRAYGTNGAGTISGVNGLVLNVQGASTDNGAKIIAWDEQTIWNDSFKRRSTSSLLLTASAGGTERVLNIRGGEVSAGAFTELIAWSANEAHTNSQFHFKNVRWLAMGDQCVTVGAAKSGEPLTVSACTTANASLQRWTFFDGDKRIRLGATNYCVNVPGDNIANGTQLILYPCSTGAPYANETFEFSGQRILYRGKAFNVSGGKVKDGAALVLYTPGPANTPHYNEIFTIRGPITGLGQCIDVKDDPDLGEQIGVRLCSGDSNPLTNTQIWEYYW